ncbi:RpiB/LacA/LacB family sugar-phosphate isomerase [uncultured Kriegella sp.]|uniref:RpiB/LacA/LacB family sugar-phosphate isomerase n=1 Tax=uncultured Kriegella sp. TaxID=1798910 RepID=UPI0030DC9323|tara:strand:+ start:163701 stop:164171 length:471 start_codon:yes stop_codon:yes gene_type:complete
MKIAIDADRNGSNLKEIILTHIKELGHEVEDLAYLQFYKDKDYPDVAYNLAKRIRNKEFERGILICGTGLGMAIMANKVPGVYAGACNDVYAAERLQKSNNAQVLTLGSKVVGEESAKIISEAFVRSGFQKGRSLPKFFRIQEIENEIIHDTNDEK